MLAMCRQSNYGILGTVISALSRSPGPSACSRSNSLIVDHPSQTHDKVSPTNSLTVGTHHLSLSPSAVVDVRSNSFLSVDYANHHSHHVIHVDASLVTSPPNGMTSSEDESHLPPRRSRSEKSRSAVLAALQGVIERGSGALTPPPSHVDGNDIQEMPVAEFIRSVDGVYRSQFFTPFNLHADWRVSHSQCPLQSR